MTNWVVPKFDFRHSLGNKFPFANPTMDCYIECNDWPSIENIQHRIFLFETQHQVCYYLKSMPFFNGNGFHRIAVIVAIETIKANRRLLYNGFDDVILTLADKFDEYPILGPYIEDFKRKSLSFHCRNKVACFYFRHVDGLCQDVIEKIISYV